MDRVNISIIGAGVVGLAVAAELSTRYDNVIVVEKHDTFGRETSSRNSEVIHSGIYYPEGSLKARLCVEGSEQLYDICNKYSVPYKKLGKLIIATDIAVLGEGDETIVELLRTLSESKPLEEVRGLCFIKNDKVFYTGARPVIKDISSLPFIDRSLFDTEIYIESCRQRVNEPTPIPRDKIRALQVSTARGCIAKCTFCYHNFQGTPFRFRPADVIIAEIRHLINTYSLNYIFFWDDLTFASKQQVLEFSRKVIAESLQFSWIANCRANLFQEDEDFFLIEEAKKAGCVGLTYALESADPLILKDMNKNITVEQFSKQSALIKKAGIPIWTSVVFGYPRETPETIRKTFDVCMENEVFPSAGYLQPYPGSKIYDYAVKNGFIHDEEEYLLNLGDRQDLRLNMTRMSDEEYTSNILEGLKRCNEKLNVGLDVNRLIKTQYFRAKGKS